MREICSNYLVNHPVTLGGPGVVVQINETVMSKRKHSRDHIVPEHWVFGGIHTEQKIGFLDFLSDRSAATLLPIIERVIRPGSTIHSDQWVTYNGVANIPVNPVFVHHTVIH